MRWRLVGDHPRQEEQMNAWEQVSLLWHRSPVWRVEIVWILIGIVVTTAALTWLVTFVVMALRGRCRAVREYPDNVATLVATLDGDLSVALTDNFYLKHENNDLRYIVKVIREAVINEPMRKMTEEPVDHRELRRLSK
jgi:hypothetical protein